MNEFRLPGVVWSALMVALPLLSVWLETYFGAYAWAPAVAGLLLIIGKIVEVMRQPAAVAEPGARGEEVVRRNLWWG